MLRGHSSISPEQVLETGVTMPPYGWRRTSELATPCDREAYRHRAIRRASASRAPCSANLPVMPIYAVGKDTS